MPVTPHSILHRIAACIRHTQKNLTLTHTAIDVCFTGSKRCNSIVCTLQKFDNFACLAHSLNQPADQPASQSIPISCCFAFWHLDILNGSWFGFIHFIFWTASYRASEFCTISTSNKNTNNFYLKKFTICTHSTKLLPLRYVFAV